MKRKINQFISYMKKLSPGFWRRFIILTLVYMMVMVGIWSLTAQHFLDGTNDPLVVGLFFGISGLLFVAMIVTMEISNHRYRK